jgi:hypothetical protein
MITSRLLALLTVGRLEYSTLILVVLAGIAAKRAKANEWLVFAVILVLALMIRQARNRGVLDRLVVRCKKPSTERGA